VSPFSACNRSPRSIRWSRDPGESVGTRIRLSRFARIPDRTAASDIESAPLRQLELAPRDVDSIKQMDAVATLSHQSACTPAAPPISKRCRAAADIAQDVLRTTRPAPRTAEERWILQLAIVIEHLRRKCSVAHGVSSARNSGSVRRTNVMYRHLCNACSGHARYGSKTMPNASVRFHQPLSCISRRSDERRPGVLPPTSTYPPLRPLRRRSARAADNGNHSEQRFAHGERIHMAVTISGNNATLDESWPITQNSTASCPDNTA